MATVFILHANHRAMDEDTSFKVMSGLLCGGPQSHAQLCLDLMFKGKYRTVAQLEAETLEQVYERSQNLFHPWVEAPGVKRICPDGVRSTSVGDVLVRVENRAATLHVVSSLGFADVTQQFQQGHAHLPAELAPPARGVAHVC